MEKYMIHDSKYCEIEDCPRCWTYSIPDDGIETPDDPNSYCRHGAYVGNSMGADYMCGECESA